jgi:hypothetical protein
MTRAMLYSLPPAIHREIEGEPLSDIRMEVIQLRQKFQIRSLELVLNLYSKHCVINRSPGPMIENLTKTYAEAAPGRITEVQRKPDSRLKLESETELTLNPDLSVQRPRRETTQIIHTLLFVHDVLSKMDRRLAPPDMRMRKSGASRRVAPVNFLNTNPLNPRASGYEPGGGVWAVP